MEEQSSTDGMQMLESDDDTGLAIKRRVSELQHEVTELKKLVHTLLTVICEEADGVHSGAAPTIPGQAPRGFCM